MSDILKLSQNEGEPPPVACLDYLRSLGGKVFSDYPSCADLGALIAEWVGVPAEQILVTTGGDDVIDRVCRAWLPPDGELVVPVPTFEMIPAFTGMVGGKLVPLEYEWGALPTDRILSAVTDRTHVVAVVTPDNPTGAAASTESLLALADALPPHVTFLVDLAYVEFADEDPTEQLLTRPDTVMVRTLSKAWGLAGLRVGFGVASKERIDVLRQVGAPYPVAGPAVAIAEYMVRNHADRMREFVDRTKRLRSRLTQVLTDFGAAPHPSQTNFVLSRFPDAKWVNRGLAAQGILTRYFSHLPDYIRMTVPRNEDEIRRLEDALDRLAKPQALLFDMDGVLVDVRESYRAAIKETCRSFGVEATDAMIGEVKAAGNANDDWVVTQSLIEGAGQSAPLDDVVQRFEALYQGTPEEPGLRRHEKLIPSRERLSDLAAKYELGVVTGRPRMDAERFLAEAGITDLFRTVVCREDAPLKPDPAPVRLAMEQLGAQSAWLFGDTPDDLHAASGAGVVPIGVLPPGGGSRESEALTNAGAARVVAAESIMEELFDVQ